MSACQPLVFWRLIPSIEDVPFTFQTAESRLRLFFSLVSYRPLAHAGFPNAGALEAAPRGRFYCLARERDSRIYLTTPSPPRAPTSEIDAAAL